MLWLGAKDTRKIWHSSVEQTFFRNDANSRTDYESMEQGGPLRVKSDPDERILALFDSLAAPTARMLVEFSGEWRDEGPSTQQLAPMELELCNWIVVVQARRAWESQNRAGLGSSLSLLGGDCRRYPGGTENASILCTVSRCSPNTREASRMLIPSTITALRTRRYTSTLYIHRTIHGFRYNPMNDGGRYSIQSPIC